MKIEVNRGHWFLQPSLLTATFDLQKCVCLSVCVHVCVRAHTLGQSSLNYFAKRQSSNWMYKLCAFNWWSSSTSGSCSRVGEEWSSSSTCGLQHQSVVLKRALQLSSQITGQSWLLPSPLVLSVGSWLKVVERVYNDWSFIFRTAHFMSFTTLNWQHTQTNPNQSCKCWTDRTKQGSVLSY